jgi:hypothetical protein
MALEVQIDGNIDDLNKKIKEAELNLKELSKIKLEQIKLGLDTKEINGNIASVKKSLTELKTVAKDTGSSVSVMAPKIANGSNALMQFSRIAQDAPFGIMGIGNNITATTEAFGHLRTSTGSTSGALKAMAGSIMGTGGILLAVSLVTTGLTYMSQNGITVGDVFEKLSGRFDETAKSLKKINEEAAKSSGSEIAGMKALTEVAKDNTLSMEKRLIAVKKLQDEYPAYFGNLTKEQILNGNVKTAVDEVSKALIARARATAIAGKLGEIAAKRLELEEKREASILKIQEAQAKVAEKRGKKSTTLLTPGGGVSSQADFAKRQLQDVEYEYKQIQKEIADLDAISKKYSDREAQATKDSILLDQAKIKVLKEKKTFETPQVEGVKSQLNPADLVDVSQIAVVTGKLDQFGNKLKELPGVISTSMGEIKIPFDSGMLDMLSALQKFNEDAKSIITGSIASTFENLGTAIGTALANGTNVFSAIGNSLLASFGSFLSDMGSMLIKYGTLAVAKGVLDKAIAIPGAGIVAGAAAIAVGVALKGAGSAMGAKASGQSQGGSVNTGASYSSPASNSSFSGASASMGGGTVVFEIAGQKLIGVLSNTLNANNRLGGSITIP